jgi:hypothetical protein
VAETLGIRAFRAHFTEGGGNINRMYTTTDGDSRHDIPAELLQAMEEAGLSVYCENTECTNENHKYFERRSSKGFVCSSTPSAECMEKETGSDSSPRGTP